MRPAIAAIAPMCVTCILPTCADIVLARMPCVLLSAVRPGVAKTIQMCVTCVLPACAGIALACMPFVLLSAVLPACDDTF
eukprot:scaffold195799_cov22-Tisochrysis_lutea.AAC.1